MQLNVNTQVKGDLVLTSEIQCILVSLALH